MELELRHLRVLCAIADAGSVGRAASDLGYSQPAMSTQLQRIEQYFGHTLFERNSSGVELTRYGTEVLAQARDVLARAAAIGRRPAADGARTPRPCGWPRPTPGSRRHAHPAPQPAARPGAHGEQCVSVLGDRRTPGAG
ncbi:LysR family transcriptional regulator [Streptomyces lydicus]|nr:LysR family transcriptional regulator [Streptomyces lydicus]